METNIKDKLRVLNIIFYSLLATSVIVTAIVLYLKIILEYNDLVKAGSIMLYICPLTAMGAIMLGYYLYNKAVQKAEKIIEFNDKLNIFYNAKIMQYSLFNLAAIMSGVWLLLQYRAQNIFMFAIVLLFMALNIPNKTKFIKDFLNKKEENKKEDENETNTID